MHDFRDIVRRRLADLDVDPIDDSALLEELAQHLEERFADSKGQGATDQQAMVLALEELDGHERLANMITRKHAVKKAVLTGGSVETAWQDFLNGFRMLVKRPSFALVATLSLALGIGANCVIFSLINTTLLRPLNFPEPERLAVIWAPPEQTPDQHMTTTASAYFAFRDQNQSFESVGAIWNGARPRDVGAEENGVPAERITGYFTAAAMFKTMGVEPIMGRVFTQDEDQVDNPAPVVVISRKFWQRRFNSDPNVIGRVINLDRVKTTIIGVMPDIAFFGDNVDWWGPSTFTRGTIVSRQAFVFVVGRLKPGVSIEQAQAEMRNVAAQLAASQPDQNKGNTALVQPLQEAMYGNLRSPLLILQGAVAFVLLIGCANVAGLLLARATSRRTEVAIRTALGAGRGRIVCQLMAESIPLSLLGGALGVFLAWGGLKLFVAAAPPGFPRLSEVGLDIQVLGFTALVAILTSILFGLIPALKVSKPDLASSLKEYGRSGTDSIARQYFRSCLVTIQIALALVLLIGAGLMINSFRRLQRTDFGADPNGILAFSVSFGRLEVTKNVGQFRGLSLTEINPITTQTFEQILERVRNLPGVVSAAASNMVPVGFGSPTMPFLIEGRPAPEPPRDGGGAAQDQAQTVSYFAVSPNFFETMKIPLLQGRDFTGQDMANSPLVIIVNQSFVRRYFPNESPIGERLRLDFVPDEQPREIIAVAGDVVLNRFQQQDRPVVYVPHVQQTTQWIGPSWPLRAGMYFLLRTSSDPLKLVPDVRRVVAEINPNMPAADVRTLPEYLDQQVQYLRVYLLLLGIFGAIAVVLAAIGIYGVMSQAVSERTREIGIRMALGAGAREVLRLILRQALLVIGFGLVLGLACAFALTRLIQSALFGITPTDPATFVAVGILLSIVALAASIIPTIRATKVDPLTALRNE